MNIITKPAVLAILTVTMLGTALPCLAQQRANRGNFDPEQARARMMERYREQLEIKNDSEWGVMEPRIQKVLDARRDLASGAAVMMRGRGRGGSGGDAASDSGQGNRRARRNAGNGNEDNGPAARRGPQPSAAAQQLQQAISSNAATEELKSKLTSYREEHKQKQAKLETAQEELKKLLSVRQEATAVLLGLLQ